MILEGVIQEDGTVVGANGTEYKIPTRGVDNEGFPEVLMDAQAVGGEGFSLRQSIKPYIGMKVQFYSNADSDGYDFKIID